MNKEIKEQKDLETKELVAKCLRYTLYMHEIHFSPDEIKRLRDWEKSNG